MTRDGNAGTGDNAPVSDEVRNLEQRIRDLEAIVQGDDRRRQQGLQEAVSALREDFEAFKDIWDDRAAFFRGIFWAISANGLLGVIAIVLQIVGK